MRTDYIKEVKIDDSGRLCVFPENRSFDYIYRAAMEVNWDPAGLFLYSPKPREWSYWNWFNQILDAAKDEYGCNLLLSNKTLLTNIPDDLQENILNSM